MNHRKFGDHPAALHVLLKRDEFNDISNALSLAKLRSICLTIQKNVATHYKLEKLSI